MKRDNLPEGWKARVLTRVAQLNPAYKIPNSWDDHTEVAYLPMENVEDGTGYIREIGVKSFQDVVSGKMRFREQDILFAKITPCLEHRKIAFVERIPTEVGFGSTEFYVLKPNESVVIPKYLLYVLRSEEVIDRAVSSMTGTSGRKRVPSHAIRSMVIPLPPPQEQRQIVGILELADELRRKRKAANQLTDKIIHSLFLDMFGEPLTNPKGWEVRRLKEAAIVNKESVNPEKAFSGEEFTYIDISSVDGSTGEITSPQRILASRAPSRARRLVRKGDTVISTVRPNLKGFALIDEQFDSQICSTGFAVLTPQEGILDSHYLLHYVRMEYFVAQLVKAMKGAMYPAVNQADVEATMIHVPPLALQQRFAELVSQFEEKRKQTEQAAEEIERLYHSLLKKAFTGDLTKQWREVNQVKWELPQLTERQKVLLAVLYSYNIIQKASPPITMLMKYMFLLQQEKGLELEYAFIPYKFGPFSKEVYEDIEALERETLVIRPRKSRSIERQETALDEDATDDIEAVLATIPESKKEAVDDLVEKYGSMGFNELMNYVYSKYPEFTVESRGGKTYG